MADQDVRQLINDINKIKGVIPRELNKEFRAAARPVAQTAKRNASWSTRIPGHIKATSTRARRNPGAAIRVSKKVPHARLYEFGDGGRSFRHPVFGNRSIWVEQKTRPFIRPAVKEHGPTFLKACDDAVKTAARAAGFH